MESTNRDGKKSKTMVIVLVAIILVLALVVGFFLLPKGTAESIKKIFESKEEYTLKLDEFVLNLHAEGRTKSYLKVEVSLMYTDKKEVKTVESSVAKIRDIILNNLREKTAGEMADVEETNKLKEKIRVDINNALNGEIIKEVYYTNLIVQ